MATGTASTDFAPVPGARLASLACGIKADGSQDLALIAFDPGAMTAGVFTQSHFAAAPVQLARQHLSQRQPRYLLINSGNANAATGADGLADAKACCVALAEQAGVAPEEVLPFSTGVIGERLAIDRITQALPLALDQLSADNWLAAAK
ncbi:MAG: bifunctional ornithine acetyltransferase/N-acetylglutamate synthase, partial [Pseudomonadales bacterium]